MTYSVTINEKSREGKSVVTMLKLLADKYDGLHIVEEVEDKALVKLLKSGQKSGLADTSRVLKKLKLA
jgi:purine nucleoside permease